MYLSLMGKITEFMTAYSSIRVMVLIERMQSALRSARPWTRITFDESGKHEILLENESVGII